MADPSTPDARVTEALTRIRAIADEALADDPVDQTAQQLRSFVDELARAHLAEREILVRALLAVEWTSGAECTEFCPSCGGLRYPMSAYRVGHATDCELDAALRKAGVRK